MTVDARPAPRRLRTCDVHFGNSFDTPSPSPLSVPLILCHLSITAHAKRHFPSLRHRSLPSGPRRTSASSCFSYVSCHFHPVIVHAARMRVVPGSKRNKRIPDERIGPLAYHNSILIPCPMVHKLCRTLRARRPEWKNRLVDIVHGVSRHLAESGKRSDAQYPQAVFTSGVHSYKSLEAPFYVRDTL